MVSGGNLHRFGRRGMCVLCLGKHLITSKGLTQMILYSYAETKASWRRRVLGRKLLNSIIEPRAVFKKENWFPTPRIL
jgi:hypothetical protein